MSEAEVGEVDAVDGAVVFHAIEASGFDVVDIAIAFSDEAVEVAAEGGIFARQIFLKETVIAGVGINRAFEHHDGCVWACLTENFYEVVGQGVTHHLRAVGHRIDEIDVGVSGRAAQKVAMKLREVSKGRQVICVTHLSQIAAMADCHMRISKSVRDGKTYTEVERLDIEGRKRELARITGGLNVTELQLRNAEEMLRSAGVLK